MSEKIAKVQKKIHLDNVREVNKLVILNLLSRKMGKTYLFAQVYKHDLSLFFYDRQRCRISFVYLWLQLNFSQLAVAAILEEQIGHFEQRRNNVEDSFCVTWRSVVNNGSQNGGLGSTSLGMYMYKCTFFQPFRLHAPLVKADLIAFSIKGSELAPITVIYTHCSQTQIFVYKHN